MGNLVQTKADYLPRLKRAAGPSIANGRHGDQQTTNKPAGDNARKGAVRKRTQLKGKLMGKTAWTKRSKSTGNFMDVKKSAKKFKGVRREKKAA